MKKTSKTFFTGLAMGLADLVPGVSGGTIAFMSGLYEEIINALSGITRKIFDHLLSGRFKAFWKGVHGNFLGILFLGMGISILAGSRILDWVMTHYPLYLTMFFVGLIVFSTYFLFKKAHKESNFGFRRNSGIALLGVLLGAMITLGTGVALPFTGPGYILAGILGSLAMLLPGISGSYILLILGMYAPIIGAVSKFSEALSTGNTELLFNVLPILISVGVGVIIGILLMSKVMKRLLNKRHTQTVLILIGVMLGALPAIMPERGILSLSLPGAISAFIVGGGLVSLFFIKNNA